jgi:hypothetical protein
MKQAEVNASQVYEYAGFFGVPGETEFVSKLLLIYRSLLTEPA